MATTEQKLPRVIGYAEYDGCDTRRQWTPPIVTHDWSVARVIINTFGQFELLNDSGCSCDSPGDNPMGGTTEVGPAATLGGLFDELQVGRKDGKPFPGFFKEAFLDALKTINDETIADARKALGL